MGGAPGGPVSRPGRGGSRTRRRAFLLLLGGASVSSLGDGVRGIAFPVAASIVTTDPVSIAAVTAAGRLPWLLAPVLGVVVDGRSRLALMGRVDAYRAAVAVGLAAAFALGWISLVPLLLGALLLGLGEVLFDSAAQAVIPDLAADGDLERANGRLMAVQTATTQFAGPLLGSALVAVSLSVALALDAGSFLISTLAVLVIAAWRLESRDRRPAVPMNRDSVTEGLRWSLRDRAMRSIITLAVALSFLDGLVGGTLVVFVIDALHAPAIRLGLLLALASVGAVVGSVATARLLRAWSVTSVLTGSTVLAGAAYLLMARENGVLLAAVWLALNSAGTMIWNVTIAATRQRVIPPEFMGRVIATFRMAAWGALPVGTLLGGVVAATLGARAPALIAGIGLVAVGSATRWILPGDALLRGEGEGEA